MRMRTLTKSIEHIHSIDPDTALTYNALRRMVLNGTIPHVKVGNKRLINVDTIGDYIYATEPEQELQTNPFDNPDYGKIRKLEVY